MGKVLKFPRNPRREYKRRIEKRSRIMDFMGGFIQVIGILIFVGLLILFLSFV